MKPQFKKFKETVKDLTRDDLVRQLYYSLNAEKEIPWQKYDPFSRDIESHVNHLITDGLNVWVAFHAKRIGNPGYTWHDPIDKGYLNLPITHFAPINLPREEETT